MAEVKVTVQSDSYTPEALANYVRAQLDDLFKNPGIATVTCMPAMMHDRELTISRLCDILDLLKLVIEWMISLYGENDWLNEAIDISNIVPMSLDEWWSATSIKEKQLRSGHLQ